MPKYPVDKAMPNDASGRPMPLTPATTAVAITYDTTISSSTTVGLNPMSSMIEVSALSHGVFMKWGATASSSAFDEYIQAGATRHYAIPNGQTTVQFIEQAASATLIVIEK